MMFYLLAVMVVSPTLRVFAVAPPCPVGTVSMSVTAPAHVQELIASMNCTGEGTFNVTWTGSVQLVQRIKVSENKQLTVTGSSRVLGDISSDVIDAGRTTSIFAVYNESTLILKDLVLEGGSSEEGAAIDARSFSSVRVAGCAFTNNNATKGGAIRADESEVLISGDTVFADNSAKQTGGAISSRESMIHMDGNITFENNYAGDSGGALYAYESEVNISGESHFRYNSVPENGGAFYSSSSNVSVDGYSLFYNNSAGNRGGGLYTTESVIYVSGESLLRYNSAQDSGGAIGSIRSKIISDGNISFANNSCLSKGGALIAFYSEIYFNGTTLFTYNLAQDKGGALAFVASDVSMAGETTVGYNTALTRGGALFLARSPIRMAGRTWFGFNSAVLSGGAVQTNTSPLFIEGYSVFTHNTAGEDGGAINGYSFVEVDIVGVTVFSNNSAVWRGGAFNLVESEMRIRGSSWFGYNSGYDGGAIVAHESPLYIDGNTTFVGNSAEHDGGAIAILGSDAIILGKVDLLDNTAVNGGAIYSALSPVFQLAGKIYFFGNQATFYGGAVSLADATEVHVVGAKFESNTGAFGGAVSMISTANTTGRFESCRFVSNDATNGGALYTVTGDTGASEHTVFVQKALFLNNIAEAFGGALYNSGDLEISGCVFSANTAGEGGLAVHDEGSWAVLANVTFYDNMFSCPVDKYSDAHHDSGGTCRLEVVCQQCSQGCRVDDTMAKVTIDTIPVCEDVPEGVSQESTPTLETFDLLEGYYRVSAESRVVRECYREDACRGGTDALNYCATGYIGPYCAVCDEGYAPGVMNLCHECSENIRRWSVGVATAALIIAVLAAVFVVFHAIRGSEDDPRSACHPRVISCYKWLVKGLPLSAIKIVVVVLQIITQFTEIAGAVYPDEYEAFLAKLTAINLDIGFILSNSCIVTTNFYARLLVATIGPLIVLALLFGTLLIARRRERNTGTEEPAEPILHTKRASLGLFILFFVYSSASFTIFQTFVCDDLDDGMSYLRADYSLLCTSDEHKAYTLYASIMVCMYPVGIPALFAWWLVHHRQDLQKPDREELAHLQSSRGLWDAYSPSCYYFEVVECFRRIVLTGAAVFVLPNSAEQIAIIFLLAVVFTFISESLSPFANKADMWLYRWGNAIILASMYVALLLKAELTDQESETSTVMTVLLISANMFLVVTVVVQAGLLMKGVYEARKRSALHPSPAPPSFAQQSAAMEPVA